MRAAPGCSTCVHRDGEHCHHPSVRLVGVRVALPAAGTCEDWEGAES